MKKIIAVLMAVLMAAAIMPAALAVPVGAEDFAVEYTGSTVYAQGLTPGDTFYLFVSVSENSAMWSGHWLIDYPEEYITPTAYSVTFAGGVTNNVTMSMVNDEQTSDLPNFVCDIIYEGMTGSNPYGEEGNLYTVVGMFLDSFDFGGLQAGGDFVRVKYRLDVIPEDDEQIGRAHV